jgi:hypothetical protein
MVTSRERRRRDLLEVPAYRLDVRGRVDLRRPGDVVGRRRALGRRPRASPRPGNCKLEAAAKASPDDQPSAELRALIDAPSAIWVNVLDGAVWLALIFVMVGKPFS